PEMVVTFAVQRTLAGIDLIRFAVGHLVSHEVGRGLSLLLESGEVPVQFVCENSRESRLRGGGLCTESAVEEREGKEVSHDTQNISRPAREGEGRGYSLGRPINATLKGIVADLAQKPVRKFDRSIVDGPIPPAVWKLAWPTMLQNSIAGLQGIIDHAMVG